MSNSEAFYSELHNYVQKMAAQMIDLSGGNPVVSGAITQSLGTHYVIQLNEGGSESSVRAVSIGSANFKVGDSVYLIKADNTLDSTYYIIGKVEAIQESYVNLTLDERFQIAEKGTLSFDGKKNILGTKINDTTVISLLKQHGTFRISGTFTCIEDTDDYGVRVEFLKDETLVATYELNTNYFIGQPFKMTGLRQIRTVYLDEVVLKSGFDSLKVSTFGSGFDYSDIALDVGYLLNIDGIMNVSVAAANGKNYFSKHDTEINNNVQFKASVTYEDVDFVADNVQYYWVLKNDSITENNDRYLGLAGEGWECINGFEPVSGYLEGADYTLSVWDNKENSISFECLKSENKDDNNGYKPYFPFTKFKNTIKCIIRYQNLVVESDEFTVYNYNEEEFSAIVEASANPALLITQDDLLTLTCQIYNANFKTSESDYTYTYHWFVEDSEIENANQKTLVIGTGSTEEYDSDKNIYYLTKTSIDTKKFKCKVAISLKKNSSSIGTKESNSVDVTTRVAAAAQNKSTTFYKYYIATNSSVDFEKQAGTDNTWTGDWIIYETEVNSETGKAETVEKSWITDENLATWTGKKWDGSKKADNEAYNYIRTLEKKNNNGEVEYPYYIYITSQTVFCEEKLESDNLVELRKENWKEVTICKYALDENNIILNDKSLEKLNTFNSLTGNGSIQGIQYDEDTGDAYINATYINTGVLRVGEEGNELFYADIDNTSNDNEPQVKIAGFTVDQNSISHNKNNATEQVYLGIDGLKISDALSIEKGPDNKWDGKFKGSFIISGEDGEDDKDVNTSIKTLNTDLTNLEKNTKVATYFGVNTDNNWIYLKAKDESTKNPGFIYFNTDNLIINSNNFKLNYDNGYKAGALYLYAQNDEDNYLKINTGAEGTAEDPVLQVSSLSALSTNLGEIRTGIIYSNDYDFSSGRIYLDSTELDPIDLTDSNEVSDITYETISYTSLGSTYHGWKVKFKALILIKDDFNNYNSVSNFVSSLKSCTLQNGSAVTVSGATLSDDNTNNEIIKLSNGNYKVRVCYTATVYSQATSSGLEKTKPKTFNILDFSYRYTKQNGAIIAFTNTENIEAPCISFPKFNVDKEGNITATGGTIGGYNISADALMSSDGKVGLSGTNEYNFWAGANSSSVEDIVAAPFYVTKDGSIKAISGNVGGFQIGADYLKLENIFELNSINEEGKKGASMYFYLSEQTEAGQIQQVIISNDGINTQNLSTNTLEINSGLLNLTQLSVDNILINNTNFSIQGEKLGNNDAYFDFSFKSGNTKLEYKLSITSSTSKITVSIENGTPEIYITCYIVYHYNYNSDKDHYTTITFEPGDSSTKTITRDSFWGLKNAKFVSINGTNISNTSATITGYRSASSIQVAGDLIPITTGTYSLGSANNAWNYVYYSQSLEKTATSTSSDKNVKNSIQFQPEEYSLIFDELQPVIFKYNYGTSDRYHTGLIAQDVEQAVLDAGLTTQDFGAICYDIDDENNKINYGIRYGELVSMCVYEIQKLKKQVKELQEEVDKLKNLG